LAKTISVTMDGIKIASDNYKKEADKNVFLNSTYGTSSDLGKLDAKGVKI